MMTFLTILQIIFLTLNIQYIHSNNVLSFERPQKLSKLNSNQHSHNFRLKQSICDNLSIFRQKVDHFDFQNTETFDQRYIFWSPDDAKEDGSKKAVLVYTGNEGDIPTFCINEQLQFDIAKKHGYSVLFIEHRYYGESYPEKLVQSDDSMTYSYLSVEQALSDYIEILSDSSLPFTDMKVVTFGGSYGGMLSAFIRQKYPNRIAGAIVGSAPVALSARDHDPAGFNKVVTETFKYYNFCDQKIKKTWDYLSNSINSDDDVAAKFNLCRDNSKNYRNRLIDGLTGTYILLAMLNYDHAANFMVPLPAWPVEYLCDKVEKIVQNNNEYEEFHVIMETLQLTRNYTGEAKECLPLDVDLDSKTHLLSTTRKLKGIDMNSWAYQTCTQLAETQLLASSPDDLFMNTTFSSPEEEIKAQKISMTENCKSSFNVQPDFHYLQKNFGFFQGDESTLTSNTVWTNGQFDPWRAGRPNIDKNIQDLDIIMIDIEKGAHHAELMPVCDQDPISFYKARATIEKYVVKWIEN